MSRLKIIFLTFLLAITLTKAFASAASPAKEIKLVFLGDVLAGGNLNYYYQKYGYDYPWQKVKKYFQGKLVFANLESCISLRGKPERKKYTFRGRPEFLKAMKKAGVTAVSVANNHSADYGLISLYDTLGYLRQEGIYYSGAGRDVYITEIPWQGYKIGFLAFSRVIPSTTCVASPKKTGIWSIYEPNVGKILKLICENDAKYDLLVVSVHWGVERDLTPNPPEIKLAHKLVEAGADVVMGHHPHVVQRYEIYKGRPIFYSLGNFIFTSSSNKETAKTVIAEAVFTGRKLKSVEVKHGEIKRGQPVIK
ncbi:CapA family protein [Carboxydothermus ferrireducens]|uniref:Poly-gamma-glutamate synthesis protein (Capsule biosynthesis protein) n=1 Tax=Carboxydothermus ferrireducens DSM 11255 TaxID=1119529 RepID=A0ABX2R9U4_9THEO|nr:CapA family protein [Carboxydothermus ferrireducens]NYE56622.1 poly-gamma-glutamate synthesis protein (capsule biosynthesis protein) [Carboxydothermus ferrireducens DSM 11255]